MKPPAFLLASAVAASLVLGIAGAKPQAGGQANDNVRIELLAAPLWNGLLWDDANGRLIAVGSHRRPPSPARLVQIATYEPASGEKHSVDLADSFPSTQFTNVNAVAAGPGGTLLVACELGTPAAAQTADGDRLLLYDRNLGLVRNLNSYPYDVAALAMDKDGSMYVLGGNLEERSNIEAFPLIVKYDQSGHVTEQMLPRLLFTNFKTPAGHGEIKLKSPAVFNGWNAALAVDDHAIRAYLPAMGAMIVLDHAGKLQKPVDVATKLLAFAKAKGYPGFSVTQAIFSPAGDLWIEGSLGAFAAVRMKGNHDFLVRLTPAGELQDPYPQAIGDEPFHPIARLIGFTKSGDPVASSDAGTPSAVVLEKNPY